MKPSTLLAIAAAVLALSSCATYVTPGGRADFSTFTEASLKEAYSPRPAANFPAHLIVARVQDSGYRSHSTKAYGQGRFSVLTTRDIETERDFERLTNLDGVAQVGGINRLLLPNSLGSDMDLRRAAAQLHGDLLLIYTLDTSFHDEDLLAPLTTITLGLAPTKKYEITSTAAALLMDARTGYVYGVLEETEDRQGLTIGWGSRDAIDAARRRAERAALDKLLDAFETFWARIYRRYG